MKYLQLFIILILTNFTTSCYVIKQGYGYLRLLNKAQPIEEIATNKNIDSQIKEKVKLTQRAKYFAVNSLGLKDNQDFNEVIMLPDKELIHLLFVAYKKQLKLVKWWYPIVGSFKYKGFYDLQDALDAKHNYDSQGYETYLTIASSFSGLDWIDTPLTSNMFEYSDLSLAGIIFHELAHATNFFPGHTKFNESYAIFVEQTGSIQFLHSLSDPNAIGDLQDLGSKYNKAMNKYNKAMVEKLLRQFHLKIKKKKQLKKAVTDLIRRLKTEVYNSDSPNLSKRELIFRKFKEKYQNQYKWYFASPLNNARILASNIYNPELQLFHELFNKSSKSWKTFHKNISKLKNCSKFSQEGPFEALKQVIENIDNSYGIKSKSHQ